MPSQISRFLHYGVKSIYLLMFLIFSCEQLEQLNRPHSWIRIKFQNVLSGKRLRLRLPQTSPSSKDVFRKLATSIKSGHRGIEPWQLLINPRDIHPPCLPTNKQTDGQTDSVLEGYGKETIKKFLYNRQTESCRINRRVDWPIHS